MILLVNATLITTVLLVVVFVFLWLLPRTSASLRHWILAVALACAGGAFAAASFFAQWPVPIDVTVSPPLAMGRFGSTMVDASASATMLVDTAVQSMSPGVGWHTWFLRAWLAGLGLSLTWLLIGILRLRSITARAAVVTASSWLSVASRLTRSGRRGPTIRLTNHPGLLVVWGWPRTTILIPQSALQWHHDTIDVVLQHEMAHVARRDWLVQIGAELVRAVYWFHPLVWLACARLRAESDRACDDAAIASGLTPSNYAAELLDVARRLRAPAPLVPAPSIVNSSTLERRIAMILESRVSRAAASRRARAAAALAIVTVMLTAAGVAASRQFASVTGTFVDPTNGVLPGVTLVLINTETKAKYEIQTDRNGRYEFVGLPIGTYSLESKLPGFAVFRSTLTVAGKNVLQDVMLAIGTLQESITVIHTVPLRSAAEEEARLASQADSAARLEQYKLKRAQQKCPPVTSGTAIGGNLRPPAKYVDVKPVYPDSLATVDGEVILQTIVGTDGKVGQIEVASATEPAFAESAIAAVRRWEFDATLLNCQAVETAMTVTVRFRPR